jgi:hypothetical protein
MKTMSNSAELRARKWLAEQLAWERRLEELREAAGVEGAVVTEHERSRTAA